MKRWIILFGIIFIISCSPQNNDLEVLVNWMSGSFSSQEQSLTDTTYFDIRLQMVPVWKGRTDGYWLYVEQAVADYLDKPYRQRVYHVTRIRDNKFSSQVYSIPDPLRLAGEWKKENPLRNLNPDSLINRKGCEIILKRKDQLTFAGSTVGKNCESKLRGAAYATSEVVITEHELISWDRGFNESGSQVWGAEKGGYIFKKIPSEK